MDSPVFSLYNHLQFFAQAFPVKGYRFDFVRRESQRLYLLES